MLVEIEKYNLELIELVNKTLSNAQSERTRIFLLKFKIVCIYCAFSND